MIFDYILCIVLCTMTYKQKPCSSERPRKSCFLHASMPKTYLQQVYQLILVPTTIPTSSKPHKNTQSGGEIDVGVLASLALASLGRKTLALAS